MDHRPFLEQIIADPENDDPRLIYADWLSEQGNVRGEFIRLQCRRAGTPWWRAEYWDSLVREHQLLREHESEWMGELDDLVYQRQFHRGFPSRFRIFAEPFIKRGDRIAALTPIDHVVVARGKRFAKPLVAELEKLQIPSVDFEFDAGDLISSIASGSLALGLKHLSLSLNRSSAAKTFADCKKWRALNSLDVRGSNASDVLEMDSLYGLKVFRTGPLSDRAVSRLEDSPVLENLEALSLPYNNASQLSGVLQSTCFSQLQSLDIRASNSSDFFELTTGNLPSIRCLHLSGISPIPGHSHSSTFGELCKRSLSYLLNSPEFQQIRVFGLGQYLLSPQVIDELFHSKFWSRLFAIEGWLDDFSLEQMFDADRVDHLRYIARSGLRQTKLQVFNEFRKVKLTTPSRSEGRFHLLEPWRNFWTR